MLGEGSFQRLLNWLRAGYPEGIPPSDYAAVFGVLARRLTPTEIEHMAQLMIDEGDISADNDAIRRLVQHEVLEHPSDADVQRISERLAEDNWPLSVLLDAENPTSSPE